MHNNVDAYSKSPRMRSSPALTPFNAMTVDHEFDAVVVGAGGAGLRAAMGECMAVVCVHARLPIYHRCAATWFECNFFALATTS